MIAASEPLRVLAVRDLDEESLKRSSSGGGFSLIARSVIERGGVVYGAAYGMRDESPVVHVRVESLEGLERLQGSKYVQSEIGDSYGHCLEDLLCGREVVFSGTPCQVAGLRSYLAMKRLDEKALDGLWCVDLVCHGVPSPKIFRMYLDWLSAKHCASDGIDDFTFRDKRSGWYTYYSYSYSTKSGKRRHVHGAAWDDPFYAAYLAGALFRECCYCCPYACSHRQGDITVGDFWGVETACPEMLSDKGVSLMLLNNQRAVDLFEDHIQHRCVWRETSFELAARGNGNLTHPSQVDSSIATLRKEVYDAVDRDDPHRLFDELLHRQATLKSVARKVLPPTVYRLMKSLKTKRARSAEEA